MYHLKTFQWLGDLVKSAVVKYLFTNACCLCAVPHQLHHGWGSWEVMRACESPRRPESFVSELQGGEQLAGYEARSHTHRFVHIRTQTQSSQAWGGKHKHHIYWPFPSCIFTPCALWSTEMLFSPLPIFLYPKDIKWFHVLIGPCDSVK